VKNVQPDIMEYLKSRDSFVPDSCIYTPERQPLWCLYGSVFPPLPEVYALILSVVSVEISHTTTIFVWFVWAISQNFKTALHQWDLYWNCVQALMCHISEYL